ncbi:hypothetical protein J6T66_06025 [bacterium]|nr:hypothetical protein [bacterium]
MENYDSSPEIRQAINDNASLDNLKKVAEQSTIPEAVRNNPHYQRVSSDLDELVNRTLRGRNIDQLSNAERFRLDDISEFRKSLQNMNPKDIERTVDLL